MGLIAKTKAFFRHKGASKLDNDAVFLPVRDKEPQDKLASMTHLRAEDGGREHSHFNEIDIDIRLDHDLSDFTLPVQDSRFRDIELDVDLTGPADNSNDYIETQVLDINPLKSFSRQVNIDLERLKNNGYITPNQVNLPLASAFRTIKRPLLNNVLGKGATVVDNANLIMISSSLSGEGKTFSAINLAISMAMERDKKILLVDADANKPSHHEIFGLEMEEGLTDYLMGKVSDVSKIISKTNIPSLSLMFTGERTPHATELFASQAMMQFLEELSQRYDDRIIIFDSAPLLLPTEASVLASHMGQVVLVVEAEQTRRELLSRSVGMLNNRIVLVMLNKVREKSDLGQYGYYGSTEEYP